MQQSLLMLSIKSSVFLSIVYYLEVRVLFFIKKYFLLERILYARAGIELIKKIRLEFNNLKSRAILAQQHN